MGEKTRAAVSEQLRHGLDPGTSDMGCMASKTPQLGHRNSYRGIRTSRIMSGINHFVL
ncbi:hypothetical protein [Rothia koreensis]|jgi:hypothetical protein|uniref:hypothetical protein n=1 Tax=Rothia koreensis TaxID=592378 RepID=UPI003FCDB808